jgi:hypothetical protein
MSLSLHDLSNVTHTRAAMPLCEQLATQCTTYADAAAHLSPLLIREKIPNGAAFGDRIDDHPQVHAFRAWLAAQLFSRWQSRLIHNTALAVQDDAVIELLQRLRAAGIHTANEHNARASLAATFTNTQAILHALSEALQHTHAQ